MAKRRTEYKNGDNSETNILPYIDVYKRIRQMQNRIVSTASEQPRR